MSFVCSRRAASTLRPRERTHSSVRELCVMRFGKRISSDWIFVRGVNILFFRTYSPFAMRSRQRKPRARVASDLAGLSLAP
jgi:hypothetical protein